MSVITIDAETIPDEGKVELHDRFVNIPEEAMMDWHEHELTDNEYVERCKKWRVSSMSLTPEYCRIVGLNFMAEGQEPVSQWAGETLPSRLNPGQFVPVTETSLLRKFWQLARENSTIVTFNGLGFDLEVIKVRSAVLGIEATCDLTNLKPWENRIVDMMKKMYSNRKAIGLKKIREIYWDRLLELCPDLRLYVDLLTLEGDSVYELYMRQDIETLRRYGQFDALTNMALYAFGRGLWW